MVNRKINWIDGELSLISYDIFMITPIIFVNTTCIDVNKIKFYELTFSTIIMFYRMSALKSFQNLFGTLEF